MELSCERTLWDEVVRDGFSFPSQQRISNDYYFSCSRHHLLGVIPGGDIVM